MSRTALLAALLAAPVPALADPGPVCGHQEVLAVVQGMVLGDGAHGVDAWIRPGVIGEVPTASPKTVLCTIRLLEQFYDTPRHGLVPLYREWTYGYTVRRGRNGLFVDAVTP